MIDETIQFDYWNPASLQTLMLLWPQFTFRPDDIRVQIWDVPYLGQTKKPDKNAETDNSSSWKLNMVRCY